MRNYLLVDFGASLVHTHHSRVIRGFSELIEQDGWDLTVYLPLGSEIATYGKKSKYRRVLVPSYHPVAFCARKPRTWFPGFLGVIYRGTENSSVQRTASRVLSRIVVSVAFFQIRPELRKQPDTVIVFPTACPISLYLGRKVKERYPFTKLVYRLTNTAERRGYFAKYLDFQSQIAQLVKISATDIRFGYEMDEYRQTLALPDYSLFFSPTPTVFELSESHSDTTKKTFGFLGMAQRHKGINWMPEIVSKTLANSKSGQLSWIIQTENPPAEEFLELSSSSSVELLPGRISEIDISSAFNRIDLICLPYNVETYTLNASALAYRAADNLTAVATFRGSAFANEIEKFSVGLVCDDLEDLITRMSEFDSEQTKRNITEYNRIRIQSNSILLTW